MSSVALVTGASSGIGLAATRALAGAGWTVVATARHPETAQQLRDLAAASPEIHVRPLDVTIQDSVDACVDAVLSDLGGIDVLVNNAGGGYRGTLEQLTVTELTEVMDLNFFGVVRMTKAVLPAMRAARSGRIITVTSLNGVVGMPFSDAYNAAKFAVEGLMEGLATVMREFGVVVSVLEPGPVNTAFFANVGGRRGADRTAGDADAVGTVDDTDDPYGTLLARYDARIGAMGANGQSAESVAEVIAAMAVDPSPALRYQSSEQAQSIAAQKLVDPTGRTILAATGPLLAP